MNRNDAIDQILVSLRGAWAASRGIDNPAASKPVS